MGRKHDRAYLRIAGYARTEVFCFAQGVWTGDKSNRVRCGSQQRRDRKAERESAIRPCVFSPYSKADGLAAQAISSRCTASSYAASWDFIPCVAFSSSALARAARPSMACSPLRSQDHEPEHQHE
jgi:hypothetical protein